VLIAKGPCEIVATNSRHVTNSQSLPLLKCVFKITSQFIMVRSGYNMDNLEHLKFCQQPIEGLILFSKLAIKKLKCNFLLGSETTYEKPIVTIHVDIGLISLKFT